MYSKWVDAGLNFVSFIDVGIQKMKKPHTRHLMLERRRQACGQADRGGGSAVIARSQFPLLRLCGPRACQLFFRLSSLAQLPCVLCP